MEANNYPKMEEVPVILKFLEGHNLETSLHYLIQQFKDGLSFSTSFSLEDQVITHYIAQSKLPIKIFTLDTGRLFPETYSTWERTLERYEIEIEAYFPEAGPLEKYIKKNGPNGFYRSIDNRKECCQIRKVSPLNRALSESRVWISGLRAEHSSERENLKQFKWDPIREKYTYYPVLQFTEQDLRKIINAEGIPYNILFDKGFPSIGCAPCTRAIQLGESMRAGRWWWENQNAKECGIHSLEKST